MPLKAVILVGGYGTRLRPFTFSTPKPLMPFMNKAIVMHQIEALVKVGVKEIVLAVNVQPQVMTEFCSKVEKQFDVKIHFSKEDVPLGTAGPLALAKKWLGADKDPFFMFNSDVTSTYPLQAMLDFHRKSNAEGTIFVTPVDDPSKYGVVLYDDNGKINEFVEKPQKFVGNRINAGMYLFNPAVLDRVELRPTSIEREIFPAIAKDNKLFAMDLPGYWMDIGQPKDYLTGMTLHLGAMGEQKDAGLALDDGKGYTIKGNVLVDPSAKIGQGCLLGPNVTIGANVVIGDGSRITRACLLDGVKVGQHCVIKNSIIGWNSSIGNWAHLDWNFAGEGVSYVAEVVSIGATVCLHKSVKGNITEPQIVL